MLEVRDGRFRAALPQELRGPGELGGGRRRARAAGAHDLVEQQRRGGLPLRAEAFGDLSREDQHVAAAAVERQLVGGLPQRGDRRSRVAAGQGEQGAAEVREPPGGNPLEQRQHRRAFGRLATAARVGAGRPEQRARPLHVAAIQRNPPLQREQLDARVARDRGIGAVQLAAADVGPSQRRPQREDVVSREAVAGLREPLRRGIEPAGLDQGANQRRLRQRLGLERRGRIARHPGELRPRGPRVPALEERPRRFGARPGGERLGHDVGESAQGQPAHAPRGRRAWLCRQVREAAQRVGRLGGRGLQRSLEDGPTSRRVAPAERQLRREAASRARSAAGREQLNDAVALVRRRVREPCRRIGQLVRLGRDRAPPLAARRLPVARPLRQLRNLDREGRSAAQGLAPAKQHVARRVVGPHVRQRDRPLAIRRLVARALVRPAPRHRLRAVGEVQRDAGAQQQAAQYVALGIERHRALHQRQQLGRAIELGQHALEPEQGCDIRGSRPHGGEVQLRGLIDPARALELEPLADPLSRGSVRHPQRERRSEDRRPNGRERAAEH